MRSIRMFGLVLIFLLGLFTATVVSAQGGDAKALLTQANNELRQAEKDMFAGNTDKAVAALGNIGELLAKVKAADPNNISLKAAEKKYTTLTKDLERRTGKSQGSGAATSAEPSAPATQAAAPAAAAKPAGAVKLPYAARQPLTDATQQCGSLDRTVSDLADPSYPGDKDQLVARIENRIAEIKKLLAEAKQLAADGGVTSHPDFDKVEASVAAAETKAAQAKGNYEKGKVEMAAKSKEVDADVAVIQAEAKRLQPFFDVANGAGMRFTDLKTLEDFLARIEAFEKNDLAGASQKMQTFAQKYGSTKDEIDQKTEAYGYTGQSKASYAYMALVDGIANAQKTRAAEANDLVSQVNGELAGMGQGHDFFVVDKLAEVKTWLAMAARFQPDNPRVKDAQASLDQRSAQIMRDFNAKIDKRTWPGNAPNAPSNAKSLAKEALDWFEKSPDWGKSTKAPCRPLAVAVTGPWSVQERNIVGEPTMYGLPVLLAIQMDSDKGLNVARVFSLTMRTAEMKGAKMEPPFDSVTVGGSYFIRPSAVK